MANKNMLKTEYLDPMGSAGFHTEWTVARVERVLRALDDGDISGAAALSEAILTDDRVRGVLNTRVNAVLGLERRFSPTRPARLGREVEALYPRVFPNRAIRPVLRTALMLGVAVAELVWDKGYKPSIKAWPTQFINWRANERAWYVITEREQVRIDQTPEKWSVLSLANHRPWLEGLVRSLAIPWLIRQFARRDWARYSEIHGQPVRVVSVPDSADDEDAAEFLRSVAQLGRSGVVQLVAYPDGQPSFDLKLLEATGQSHESFKELLKQVDDSIAIAILGQNLTTNVEGGSYAAAGVHDQVRQDILEDDALIQGDFENGIIAQWLRVHHGNRYGDDVNIVWYDSTPPTNLKLRAETLATLAGALTTLKAAGIDIAPVVDEFGLLLLPEQPQPAAPQVPLEEGEDEDEADDDDDTDSTTE